MGKSILECTDTKEEWNNLKEAIKTAGFTVGDVCEEAQTNRGVVSGWSHGKTPSVRKLNDMKNGLRRLIEKREKFIKSIK